MRSGTALYLNKYRAVPFSHSKHRSYKGFTHFTNKI